MRVIGAHSGDDGISPMVIAEIRLYKKLVRPNDKREEGKQIIMTLNDTTQQITTDEAQALGNTISGAFPADKEATNTTQIYFTVVEPP
jgi:hypothetical protein